MARKLDTTPSKTPVTSCKNTISSKLFAKYEKRSKPGTKVWSFIPTNKVRGKNNKVVIRVAKTPTTIP